MNRRAIKNSKIILQDRILDDKILIYDEKIIAVTDRAECAAHLQWFDAGGNYLSPGFIDIHIHGTGGADTMDAGSDALKIMSQKVCENGVTAFLPTTISMPAADIKRALQAVRNYMAVQDRGAKVLGAHLEGPFINPNYKGAHNGQHIVAPDLNLVEEYFDIIKIITMAPETDEGYAFIDGVQEQRNSIILSMGHSAATYEGALTAIDKGFKSVTHTFSRMKGLHHREPGMVGAALKSDIYCELVADPSHIHPAVFGILCAIKNKDKVVLVTDSIRAAGMQPGVFDLGGQQVTVTSETARLKDGTLAGSIIKMNEAVKNIRDHTSLSLPEIIQMASLNPVTLLGLESEKGSIKGGKDADFTILDNNMNVTATVVAGRLSYRQDKHGKAEGMLY